MAFFVRPAPSNLDANDSRGGKSTASIRAIAENQGGMLKNLIMKGVLGCSHFSDSKGNPEPQYPMQSVQPNNPPEAQAAQKLGVVDFEANFKTFFEALTTRRTSEMMLDENLRQLEVTIMKEYSGPVTRVPDYIETRSTASWAATPANNDWTTSAAAMEKKTRFEIDDESAEPVELRLLRRFKRKLQERRQRHPPMEYFADGCSVPKDHPDVDEIIVYLQPDTECQLALELPHTTATNSSASASSESLALSGSDGKGLGLPGYGSMPALHFDYNNPPPAEICFLDLPIDHAALGYASTTSNPVCGYNPQAVAFPPQTTNVAIAEHYGHPLHVFHDAAPSVRFNPFADDGPIVDQSQTEGHSNANTGRPVFTNPFDCSSNILSNAIFRTVPDEHIHSSPQQQYTAIPTEHAYNQADAVAHRYYASNQTMYSQYDTVSRTNTDDSSSRSSSRTFVDDSEPVAPRIFYWVDRFNKLRKI
ncbi:hypothetical protein EV421DRAFT_2023151 [Armillaria borealis]|uniref:Uncharacterized protein n=1 Tax=Armillaria borealis TaxID=47425 RepID=A0AA39J256_9AGAR|nr:hypothetical protein EV421DRAFT_2023151 [Armillaria borealis]